MTNGEIADIRYRQDLLEQAKSARIILQELQDLERYGPPLPTCDHRWSSGKTAIILRPSGSHRCEICKDIVRIARRKSPD